MIDEWDYKEPSCALCGGKDFYYPQNDGAKGRIPVKRIIEKADEFYAKNDMDGAKRHLTYWQNEALELNDESGELSVVDELLGLYRKNGDKENALKIIDRAIFLLEKLQLENAVSGATVYLNAATTLKAFGQAENAIPVYEKALKIYKEKLNENDALFAGLYNNYALALCDLNRFEQAETLYLSAIEILKKTENRLPDIAISYVNLAHLYEAQDKKDKITDCMFTAFGLLSDDNNIENGYYAYVLTKCAPSFAHFGYKKIHDDMMKKAKEIYERA